MADATEATTTLSTHPCPRDGAPVLDRAEDPHQTDLCPPCTAALFQGRVASLQEELDDARSEARRLVREHARYAERFQDLYRDLDKVTKQLGIDAAPTADPAPALPAWRFIPGDVLPADVDLDAAPFSTTVRDPHGVEWSAGAGPRRRWYESERRFDSRTGYALLRECSPLIVVHVPPEPPRMLVLPDREAFAAVIAQVFGEEARTHAEHLRSWLGTRTINEAGLHQAIHHAHEQLADGTITREAFTRAVWDRVTGKLDL